MNPPQLCPICKTDPCQDYNFCCNACKPISRICCTSAEEGIKYGIPGTSLSDLIRARDYERRHSFRTSVMKAIIRAIDNFPTATPKQKTNR